MAATTYVTAVFTMDSAEKHKCRENKPGNENCSQYVVTAGKQES